MFIKDKWDLYAFCAFNMLLGDKIISDCKMCDLIVLFLPDTFSQGEPRVLGLAMIPGHHVISIEVEADSLEDSQGFGATR